MSRCSEFEHADLKDARLTARLCRVVQALSVNPAASFPKAMPSEAELEGFYRLVRNDKVNFDNVVAPHVWATVQRAGAHDAVLVAHDTTEFRFKGETDRAGLGRVGQSGQGFLGHLSLVLAGDGSREPLGVVATQTWTRKGKSVTQRRYDGELKGQQARSAPGRESKRWAKGVEMAEAAVAGRTQLIHVMDSEGDNYELMTALVGKQRRFVIRLGQDRLVDGAEGKQKVSTFLASAAVAAKRRVSVSRRAASVSSNKGCRRAPRPEREASLAIHASALVVCRPKNESRRTIPKFLPMNVVYVRELEPPEGLEPIDWILVTSELVDSEEQVLRVVDHYRARWVIEEYFKALKTGCSFEKRQLESCATLHVALGIFVPLAWNLLRLRFLSRTAPDAPATTVLTPTQLAVLRAHPHVKLTDEPTVRDALLAVAKLGGHIRNNGDPGWLVLGRGYDELLTLEVGFRLASAQPDRSVV